MRLLIWYWSRQLKPKVSAMNGDGSHSTVECLGSKV